MQHFFDQIRPGIEADLGVMKILPLRRDEFMAVASRLLRYSQQGRYLDASRATGVPEAFMAAEAYRLAAERLHGQFART